MVASSLNNKIQTDDTQTISYMFIITIILNIIGFIIIVLIVFLHYTIYTWTAELEKTGCECSNLWHRNIIHWFALVIIILNVIYYLLQFFNIDHRVYYSDNNAGLYANFSPFVLLISIITIIYMGLIYDYITKLKKLECECSESWKREYGYISNIVYMALYILAFLLAIIGFSNFPNFL